MRYLDPRTQPSRLDPRAEPRALDRWTATRAPRRALVALTALVMLAATAVGGPLSTPASAATTGLGTVYHVDDGDTLHVKVDSSGKGSGELYIRMTGINATELTTYANDPAGWAGKCNGVNAANRLHDLVYGKQVQVTARDTNSVSGGGKRLRRQIAVEIGGTWTDVGGILLDEGLALYLPSSTEWQVNKDYLRRAQVAAANHVGIWNTSSCGVGPDEGALLSVIVQWDAPGQDQANVNGEFIKIVNRGNTPVPLANWWVRDSAERGTTKAYPGYRIPGGTVVGAHSSVVVRVGKGTDTATTKYWGLGVPVFENVTGYPTYMSDGGYLFDPQGDLRAWQMYPCGEFCPVPGLKGKVAITKIVADPAGVDTPVKERVVLKNVSAAPVNLQGYELRAGAKRWTFHGGSTLNPGEKVTVYMGRGRTSRLKQYVGARRPALANAGGVSVSLDPLGTAFLCRSWGRGRC